MRHPLHEHAARNGRRRAVAVCRSLPSCRSAVHATEIIAARPLLGRDRVVGTPRAASTVAAASSGLCARRLREYMLGQIAFNRPRLPSYDSWSRGRPGIDGVVIHTTPRA